MLRIDFDISIQDLQVFLAVADRLSFKNAASDLGKSQPSVSNRIKLLEGKLQTQLFLRNTQSVQLSEEGQRFHIYAVKVVDEMADLHSEFHEKGNKRQFIVKVCSPAMIGSATVRTGIEIFEESNPGIKVQLYDQPPEKCIQSVIRGQCDFGVLAEIPFPPELTFAPLLRDSCKVITSIDHPLTRKKSVSAEEIFEHPILSPDIHVLLRGEFEKEAAELGKTLKLVPEAFEVTNFLSLLAMASSNLGVIIFPASFIPEAFLPVIGITDITNSPFKRTMGAITVDNKNLSPTALLFFEHLKKIGAQITKANS
jgi:DNA-binding transcriptional LysR family regulator